MPIVMVRTSSFSWAIILLVLNYFKHINHVFIPSFLLPRYQMRCMLVKISSLWQLDCDADIPRLPFQAPLPYRQRTSGDPGNIHDHHRLKYSCRIVCGYPECSSRFQPGNCTFWQQCPPCLFPTIVIIILLYSGSSLDSLVFF